MPERKNEAAWVESRQRWQIKVQANGVRKTFLSSTPGRKGKAAAERKADAWLEGHAPAGDPHVGLLLDQYVDYLKETKSTGHSSQYGGFVRLYIKPILGVKRMSRLTEGDLQAVIDLTHARKNLSAKTLQDIRGCMMNWLKWCRKRGFTTLHPEDLIIPASAKKPEKKVVHPSGLQTLFSSDMSTYRGKPRPDWYIHAYRFSVLTGLRPGELLGLERRDVSDDRITIRRAVNIRGEVTQGKNNNARRTIHLSDRARAELDAQLDMLKSSCAVIPLYLFPTPHGERLPERTLYHAWQRYCITNGIPPVSLYELRHTYISVNKEMPEGLKKMVVGHSKDMDTEGVYGHQMAGDLEKAAQYTDAAFKSILQA